MTTPGFHTPGKPDCQMIELLHRRHDGFISFHAKRGETLEQLVSLPADSLPGLFDQLIPDLDENGMFSVNGMFRGERWGNRRGYVDAAGKPLPSAYRNHKAIRWLTASYVDLDCHRLGLESGTVIGEVIRLQDANEIPPASVITRSGNGVWLLWLLADENGKPLRGHDSIITRWSRVQHAIQGRLARLGADAMALDAARITRVPGSINSKAGRRVSYWLQLDEIQKPFVYDLDQLARWFNVDLSVKPSRRIPDTADGAILTRNAYQIRASKGQRGRWAKALANFRRLWDLRGKFRAGTRNAAVMVLATILHSTPKGANVGLPKGVGVGLLTPGEIAAELDELFRDLEQGHTPYTRQEFDATVRRASKQRLAGQNMRNQTISDFLDVTPEEAELLPTWLPASRFAHTIDHAPRLGRADLAKRRQAILRERIKGDDIPPLHVLVDVIEQAGLGKPSQTTVQKDLDALGVKNPRKRRPRKDAVFPLFRSQDDDDENEFPETS